MKKLVLIVGLLITWNTFWGQSVLLSGRIKNEVNSKGISGAIIKVKNSSDYETVTDKFGFFIFAVPEDTKELVVIAEDMEKKEVRLSQKDKDLGEVNILLKPKPDEEVYMMSLDELMDVEVEVATKKSTGIRETANIVSIITEEQIRNSGARDMIDLIQRYVPGFAFAAPEYSEGVIGIGIRGIMSYEGRFLLLIDGMEANEVKFGSVVFGNNYTLEHIKRIEIIRGPGGAVYGGYASMGVINITTYDNESENGGKVGWLITNTGKGFTHNNASFSANYSKNDFKVAFNGVYGNGGRSDRDYSDFFGNKRSLRGNSEVDIKSLGIRAKYKTFEFSTRVRDYHMTSIDLWDTLHNEKPIDQDFQDWLLHSSYKFKLGEKFSITPDFKFKRQFPWQMYAPEYEYVSRFATQQIGGGLNFDFVHEIISVSGGVNYEYEELKHARYIHPFEEQFKDGKKKLEYNNLSAYVQSILSTKIINVVAGIRWDKSDLFGQAFSPRVGLTKAFKWFHMKAIYSQAFRAPGGILPNRSTIKLVPETSNIIEFEAGVKLPLDFYFTANIYDVETINPLHSHETAEGLYIFENSGKMGVQGFEAVLKHSSKRFNAEVNFAYYQRKERDGDEHFLAPNNKTSFLAFSPIRVNSSITWYITKKITLTPSFSFFGEKSVITGIDDNTGEPTYGKDPDRMLFNLFFHVNDFLIDGLSLGIGGNNLLGEDFRYHVASESRHAAIPALDRNFLLKVFYSFKN